MVFLGHRSPIVTARARRIARGAVAGVVIAALACAPRHAAAASTRNYLTVQGQVLDAVGNAVPGTWVFCTGSRRASAPVDSTGAYTLEIPGATLRSSSARRSAFASRRGSRAGASRS